MIGKNRGKGNALDLLDDYAGVRITDCYPGYKNMIGDQQVCWSHIIRKFRDLKDNVNLEDGKRGFVRELYVDIATLFTRVRKVVDTEFHHRQRLAILPELENELKIIIDKITSNHSCQVKKLSDLAKQLTTYKRQLFTCVTHDNVEPTNNKAERKLRHLVLKRKNSFGTKTERGNRMMEINMSVLLSLWWNNRSNFFPLLQKLLV